MGGDRETKRREEKKMRAERGRAMAKREESLTQERNSFFFFFSWLQYLSISRRVLYHVVKNILIYDI